MFMSYAAGFHEKDVSRLIHTKFLEDLRYIDYYNVARKWLIENLTLNWINTSW